MKASRGGHSLTLNNVYISIMYPLTHTHTFPDKLGHPCRFCAAIALCVILRRTPQTRARYTVTSHARGTSRSTRALRGMRGLRDDRAMKSHDEIRHFPCLRVVNVRKHLSLVLSLLRERPNTPMSRRNTLLFQFDRWREGP